jgi:class 3 adenylate cyclase
VAKLAARLTTESPDELLEKNVWGDALYFVFARVAAAGRFALDLRDKFRGVEWGKVGLPEHLGIRIALHAGPLYSRIEPVTEQRNYYGSHVSLASRIEPIAPSGQVYASQSFAALATAQGVTEFTCDYVGRVPLAKGYGTFPMYHVRRHNDPE